MFVPRRPLGEIDADLRLSSLECGADPTPLLAKAAAEARRDRRLPERKDLDPASYELSRASLRPGKSHQSMGGLNWPGCCNQDPAWLRAATELRCPTKAFRGPAVTGRTYRPRTSDLRQCSVGPDRACALRAFID